MPAASALAGLQAKAPNSSLPAVFKKYSQARHRRAIARPLPSLCLATTPHNSVLHVALAKQMGCELAAGERCCYPRLATAIS